MCARAQSATKVLDGVLVTLGYLLLLPPFFSSPLLKLRRSALSFTTVDAIRGINFPGSGVLSFVFALMGS
jgi:hypothetical protein